MINRQQRVTECNGSLSGVTKIYATKTNRKEVNIDMNTMHHYKHGGTWIATDSYPALHLLVGYR